LSGFSRPSTTPLYFSLFQRLALLHYVYRAVKTPCFPPRYASATIRIQCDGHDLGISAGMTVDLPRSTPWQWIRSVHVVQHHQRTPPTDKLTTILQLVVSLQQICHIAMPDPNISTLSICWDAANFCQLVANLLYNFCRIVVRYWACPLVVSVGGVVQHVRGRCPCGGVWHLMLVASFIVYMIDSSVRSRGSKSCQSCAGSILWTTYGMAGPPGYI